MTHPLILHIETATEVCSVALSQGAQCIACHENTEGRNHAAMLTVFIETLLAGQHLKVAQLDAVAVSAGPGSYTGLRICVSMAKGLCYGLGAPLISIPTLKIMTWKVVGQTKESESLFCPMIDARRMEVYSALYDETLKTVSETKAEIITEDSYSELLEKQKIVFFGTGADKCKNIITSPNAIFIEDIYPLAKDMIELSAHACKEGLFENTAYFEPFYLKDFIAIVSKNKVIK
jgi:tRNA threonylcarbamoyladenosine biosynthesis protein TsaB